MKPAADDLYEHVVEPFGPEFDLAELLTGRNREFDSMDFDEGFVREQWGEALAQERRKGSIRPALHFYAHIPFCRQKCAYCCYYSFPPAGKAQVEEYLDYLSKTMRFHSNRSIQN